MIATPEADSFFNQWGVLHRALAQGASDLHFCVGAPAIGRVRGELVRLDTELLSEDHLERLLRMVTDRFLMSRFYDEEISDLDYTLELPSLRRRFRVNVFRQYRGLSIVMRVLEDQVRSFQELGVPRSFEKMAQERSGLVLVTGATGSGKSTTLASLIEILNQTKNAHIITIEDPIEIVFENKRALVEQREVGTHVRDFHLALRSALREAPDVILVGEIRDNDTARMVLRAAHIGVLVLATLHTRSAQESISRYCTFFEDNWRTGARAQLADCLRGILCQKLVPTADGRGRVAACETLFGTTAVRHLIRDDKTHLLHSLMEIAAADGMTTMEQSLIQACNESRITLATAFEYCNDKQAFLSHVDPVLQKELQIDWEMDVEIKRLEKIRQTRDAQSQVRMF
ncbi:MAG: PilT/PilU family type 4a pilus ATPase [Armatimonadetes bacterium]|nr:PilT/PilU family type 4a pilus ATPase [Armatimonadota bacterium]